MGEKWSGRNPRAYDFAHGWTKNLDIARAHLEKASGRMKKWADEKRKPREFQVGDYVMVKLQPDQLRFFRKFDKRLIRKYEGPVQVIKRVGKAAYEINPPPWMKVHPVFHVSCLKPHFVDLEDPSRLKSTRAPIRTKPQRGESILAILDDRTTLENGKRHKEYLIRWQGASEEEAGWERAEHLEKHMTQIEEYLKNKY